MLSLAFPLIMKTRERRLLSHERTNSSKPVTWTPQVFVPLVMANGAQITAL